MCWSVRRMAHPGPDQRLLLQPHIDIGELPPAVFLLVECPHDWLFPHLRAAVHHGWGGTTAATLRSGIPSTVVSFFVDQPA